MGRVQVLLAAAALLPALALIACGGGSDAGLPPEEYFQRVVALDEQTEQVSDAIQEQLETELVQVANEEESVELYRQSTSAQVANFESFVDELEALDPPGAIRDEHNAGISDLRSFVGVFREVQDDMAGINSLEELRDVLRREDLAEADQRATAFCAELVQLASAEGIEISLHCRGE